MLRYQQLHLASRRRIDIEAKADESLQVLELVFKTEFDNDTVAFIRDSKGKKYFRNLRSIRFLHDRDLSILTALLNSISSTTLRTISFSVWDHESPTSATKQLLLAIGSRQGKDRIKRIELRTYSSTKGPGDNRDTLESGDFEPLYGLENLTTLVIFSPCHLVMKIGRAHV